ncbi:exodeoxyribonuclease VII large subunit [Vibrio sp.]|uniref:exodeoxyribonuclease VII large subunit n=1 Tax=Vibrio sp. TaxID=678 RepID=UPI003D0E0B01
MGLVWLIGEISNFAAPVSGHWYFTLKDSRAQVKCAMFKGNNRRVSFTPKNGTQVLVRARLSLYEPRGDYQLIVESMQPEGDGRLQQQFEQLKMQLAAEGLFAQATKQPLPEHPKRVGIITSTTGAALFDILDVLKRRDSSLPVVIYPTMVQGEEAAIQIAQAIGRANSRAECDVLIVGRGGGSLEDLWCFNHEIVARTIAASQIPIISAVGHEIDVTIADYVADMRAPTPSAAAELVSRDSQHKHQTLANLQQRLTGSIRYYLHQQQKQLSQLQHGLERLHPQHQLLRQAQQLDDLTLRLQRAVSHQHYRSQQRLDNLQYRLNQHAPDQLVKSQRQNIQQLQTRLELAIQAHLKEKRHQLVLSAETLDAVSPLATLKRGYSITRLVDGKVVSQASQVKAGDQLVTQVQDGEIYSSVIESSR